MGEFGRQRAEGRCHGRDDGECRGAHSELLDEAGEELLALLGQARVAEHAAVDAEEALEVKQVACCCRGDHLQGDTVRRRRLRTVCGVGTAWRARR